MTRSPTILGTIHLTGQITSQTQTVCTPTVDSDVLLSGAAFNYTSSLGSLSLFAQWTPPGQSQQMVLIAACGPGAPSQGGTPSLLIRALANTPVKIVATIGGSTPSATYDLDATALGF